MHHVAFRHDAQDIISIFADVLFWILKSRLAQIMVNERSEFSRSLSEKSECERPGPTRPMAVLLRGLYLRDCGTDFHTVCTGG